MNRDLKKAIELFGIEEDTSINTISSRYRELLQKWHPDHCKGNEEECRARTENIIESYKILMNYCTSYNISFTDDMIDKTLIEESPEEFMKRKFWDEGLWGYSRK
jgi:preprotein translocase subunit Sec63